MIQIEHDTGDLKREARDLVKAIYDARTGSGGAIAGATESL